MNKRLLALLIIIAAAAAILIVSLYDIINQRDWIIEVFIVYIVLFIPLFGMMRSSPGSLPTESKMTEQGLQRQFRCPSCKQTFTVTLPQKPTVFTHACPSCGYKGMINTRPGK
jgi:hypothetical protein